MFYHNLILLDRVAFSCISDIWKMKKKKKKKKKRIWKMGKQMQEHSLRTVDDDFTSSYSELSQVCFICMSVV